MLFPILLKWYNLESNDNYVNWKVRQFTKQLLKYNVVVYGSISAIVFGYIELLIFSVKGLVSDYLILGFAIIPIAVNFLILYNNTINTSKTSIDWFTNLTMEKMKREYENRVS